jgi:hypothetical protein
MDMFRKMARDMKKQWVPITYSLFDGWWSIVYPSKIPDFLKKSGIWSNSLMLLL